MTRSTDGPQARFRVAPRAHVADDVFDQLAGSILRGDLAPGSAAPSESTLASELGVSRMIARQAVHRLAEIGLVRVKQGGATIVMDPAASTDLRVLELFYRLAPEAAGTAIDPRDVIEKQLLQGHCLVDVAERRASDEDLARVRAIAGELAERRADEAAYAAFEERFWRAVAHAGRSRIFMMEVEWWYRALARRPRVTQLVPSALSARVAFYVELARRLAARDGAARFYFDAMAPTLRALHPRKDEATAKRRAKRK